MTASSSKIVVGSTSAAKLDAVRAGLVLLNPDLLGYWTLLGVDVTSAVSVQPTSDDEMIFGATARAMNAMNYTLADIAFGLESGIHQQDDGRWFDCGWVVVFNKDGDVGQASTVRFAVPSGVMDHVLAGDEMATACEKFYGVKDGKADGSTLYELMTRGRLSKISMYRDAVIAAYCDMVAKR